MLRQLGRQMTMLRQLSSADFRSFDSHFSFATWAKQAAEEDSQRLAADVAEAPVEELPAEEAPKVGEPVVATADDLCARLDACESSELANVIQAVEEALQELKDDGSFVISKKWWTGQGAEQAKAHEGHQIAEIVWGMGSRASPVLSVGNQNFRTVDQPIHISEATWISTNPLRMRIASKHSPSQHQGLGFRVEGEKFP